LHQGKLNVLAVQAQAVLSTGGLVMRNLKVYDEAELKEPVDLCLQGGKLNRQAVGWARQPLHNCNLSGKPLRKKRWNYWCITFS